MSWSAEKPLRTASSWLSKIILDELVHSHNHTYLPPMKRILTLLLAVASCEAKSIVDSDLIHKVGIIESNLNEDAVGDNGRSLGAFQISEAAWADAVAYSRVTSEPHDPVLPANWKRGAHDYTLSHFAAELILKMHEARMLKNKIKPTPMKLYMAYNMGYNAAASFGFNDNMTAGKRRAILVRAKGILSK
jgi:hypothetical protein